MPFVPNTDGRAPTEPHLAVMLKDGTFTALPRGARIAVITDPTREDGIVPMLIERVSLKALYMRCACERSGCTLRMIYKMSKMGHHKFTVGDE